MTDASRRHALKLGAAAIVVGPSVMFSRTARAAIDGVKLLDGFKGGQFTVKVHGIYDEVPGVLSVDLGSVSFVDPVTFDALQVPAYTGVKLNVASKDALKLSLAFGPEYTRNVPKPGKAPAKKVAPAAELKISVSLLAADGKTPAITYHANNAVPVSLETSLDGLQTLGYDIKSLDIVTHKIDATRHKLPGDALKIEIEGIGAMSSASMSKAVYDGGALKSNFAFDGLGKVNATSSKFFSKMSIVTFVTGERPASALVSRDKAAPGVGKLKFWATDKHSPSTEGFRFSKAVLTSIDFPKLATGSDALVTETMNFKVESTKG